MTDHPSAPDRAAELADLRARLAEAEQALGAIRTGNVDAVRVSGEHGAQIYTLSGADRAYRQLVETMSEGAATLSADGVILYCNDRLARMLELPLDRVMGSMLRTYLPPDDQQALAETLGRARTEPSRREVSLRSREGRAVPVYLSASRLDGDGAETVFALVLTDLTEQRRHAESVVAERLARSILDQAAEAIIVCDKQGLVIRASQEARRLCGCDPLQQPFGDVFRLTTAEAGPFRLAPVLHGEVLRNLDVALGGQGRELDLLLNAGPLFSGQEILGCVVTLTDITERKRSEAALRLQSAALNAAANAIVITDRGGTIQWANPAFTNLTGYTPAEAIGRTPKDLVNSGVHDQAFYTHLWDTILAGGVWFGEVTNRHKDGSQYLEEMTITPVKDDHGEITHFVALKRDLTSERALQMEFRQAQKMEAVGRLAGGVAHDFNNLLTVILTSCSFIEEELREADPIREDIHTIREASQSAATLTRQLLAFSRRQVLQPQTLDLNALVGGMEKMLGRLLGEDIIIRFQAASDLGLVIADPGQLEQVVVNLAVNARDAMAQGGTLAIDTANVDVSEAFAREHGGTSAGKYARLTVADTGCGMDPDILARAFEPFFTTKEVGKGTGLGLSTVYGIVQQSGGLLAVSSEVGRGTTFSVYLPLEAAGAQAWRPAAATAPASTAARGEAILLVEDNEPLRVLAARALRKLGYRVLEAGGLEEARRISETEKAIDLLLADVVMPGGSGHAVRVAVLGSHPGLKVLYMSGYTDDAIVQHHVLEPDVALLQKPFTPDSLGAKVREVLDAR